MGNSIKQGFFNLMRVALGLLFVFSGFVKCVDPTGGAIKIEDYFFAWGLDFIPWSLCLALSAVQSVLEFSAGFALLVGAYLRVSSAVVLAFMAFFTPLTLYIAIANPVSDCGCFGDAVKLTNWETFFKNLVFLPMAVLVFLWSREFAPNVKKWRQSALFACGLLISILVTIKGLTDEPMIDFRPFSVGTDIKRSMSIPEDAPMGEFKTTFLLEKNGEVKEFDENNYPYEDSTWVFRETRTVVIKEGYTPAIADFTFIDVEGDEHTEELLSSTEPVFLAISPKVEMADSTGLKKMARLSDRARAKGRKFFVCTSSTADVCARVQAESGSALDFLFADEVMLKTMARSNPAIMVLKDGVVVAKYHIDHVPEDSFLDAPLSTYLLGIERSYDWLQVLCLALVGSMVYFLVFKKRKKQNR